MLGYDAEIDVRYIDKKWWLGHDKPLYEVPYSFILKKGLWIHCKNIEALYELSQRQHDSTYPNFFWHQEDDYCLTSHGYVWTHVKTDPSTFSHRSIVMVDDYSKYGYDELICVAGVCTKNAEFFKREMK